MKKILTLLLFSLAAFAGRADTKTNYVYVVSNIYNQVFTENVVTQKVKNTHTNYYITNNVTTVNKIYNTTFKTNLSVNCDLSDAYVRAASNQANRASCCVTNARIFADSAASNATAAASSASSASTSASVAAYQRTQAASECESALATINARINWFDEHSGETITQNNYTWTTNIYYAADTTARSQSSANANAITNLQGRATSLEGQATALEGTAAANANAITNLQDRATSLETTTSANANAITNLQDRATQLETTTSANANAITNLQGRATSLEDRATALETMTSANATAISNANHAIANSFEYTTVISNKLSKIKSCEYPIEYGYDVYCLLTSYGVTTWSYVGAFYVDPSSATLISTTSDGTLQYSYAFRNDTSSDYRMTVTAIYKYVPASGNPYMVVVSDKGTSANAYMTSTDETVLYASATRITVSSTYRFGCGILGGMYRLKIEKNGVELVSGSLYKPKLKVSVVNGSSSVESVMLYKDWSTLSNWVESTFQKK